MNCTSRNFRPRVAMASVLLLVIAVAQTAQAAIIPESSHVSMWRDQFGDPLDAYVEAVRGETVTVYFEINSNFGSWNALDRVRAEIWWDTNVIVPGSPTEGPRANYNYVPDVDSVTSGQYYAPEDHSTPQFAHFLKVDLWYGNIYAYDGLRIAGFDIPIRADAPFGVTEIGSNFIGTDLWTGGCCHWYEGLSGDEWALHINVVSDGPACIIGDADCDGYVDIGGDILPAFTNFTGPGSFGKTRIEGDVHGPSVATVDQDPHDGDVDVQDLLTMFGAFTGPAPDGNGGLAAAEAGDANIPDLIYDSATGEVTLDVDGSGIIGYVLKNGSNSFAFGNHLQILAGVKTSVANELSEAAFASSVGANSLGNVFPTGMNLAALTAYLTVNDVSRSLGAPVVPFDLVVLSTGPAVPEPATVVLSVFGLLGMGAVTWRKGAYRRRRAA